MILKTKLFGKVYEFKSLREVMAKANEEKSGDKLAGSQQSLQKKELPLRQCFLTSLWKI